MDYSNIPLGFKITTQIPLDSKTSINSESLLKDLGFNNNLAFTYFDGMVITCQLEKTDWQWREVVGNEQGLLTNNFTYPDGIVSNGVTYSLKSYNFFEPKVLSKKVEKVLNKSLVLDSEITKLSHLDDTTDLQKPVSIAQQAAINAQLIDSTIINGVTTSSVVPLTGNIHAIGIGPGTYPNWGGMVIPANNIGTLQRVDGVYSVSLTTIDLASKVNVTDVINVLTSTETTKPLSAAQGKALNEKIAQGITAWTAKVYASGDQVNYLGKDWVSNAATLSTDVPGTSSKWVERLTGYVENIDIDSIKLLEQTDGYYLSDANGNVIAKVTSAGVQSVAFFNKAGVSISGVSEYINVALMPDGFHFTDYNGYTVAKITKDGIQAANYLDKDGNSLKSTSLNTLIKGKEFFTIGDSLSAANLWQPKLAELTNSTFNAALNTSATLSVGGTRTGGVNITCGQWRAKLLFDLALNPSVIFIENINDLNRISNLGTIDDEPFMLSNIITYGSTFASLSDLTTWLSNGSFATYLATFATVDRKIGSGIRFPYTNGATIYYEYIFDSKIVANWTNVSFWKYEGSGNTIYKSYKGLIEYLKVKFPTALLMWFAPTRIEIQTVSGQSGYDASFWYSDGAFNMTAYKASANVSNYKLLTDAQKKVCDYYAIPFINVNENCGINPLNFLTYYNQNNVHPLTIGYEKWGETIAKLI